MLKWLLCKIYKVGSLFSVLVLKMFYFFHKVVMCFPMTITSSNMRDIVIHSILHDSIKFKPINKSNKTINILMMETFKDIIYTPNLDLIIIEIRTILYIYNFTFHFP